MLANEYFLTEHLTSQNRVINTFVFTFLSPFVCQLDKISDQDFGPYTLTI